ncbi:MAG: GNAT family N-acetyltransferase [Spirochaetaceae bacterium]|jgi:Leu/Phe-tRNA-protein transferase|nr:GNAT family N-acetyltransferase [Spirochaetaceae bacterium]
MIFIRPEDDCNAVVDAMLETGYSEEFCVALDWDPAFIARLMDAGFLIMSDSFFDKDHRGNPYRQDIVLPKLHLVRSVLFFSKLHVKKSIKPFLGRYELRFDSDFDRIVQNCLAVHGDGWLTPSLLFVLQLLRKQKAGDSPRPVSFGLYRDGTLVAGEFGVLCDRVYTSYSGYKEENNAGTVQMILMARWLEKGGFEFLDFGMPMDYKSDLGAQNVDPREFVTIFRAGRQGG